MPNRLKIIVWFYFSVKRTSKMSSEEEHCSICLSDFQYPRVLPCSHSFCQQCLQQHILESYDSVYIFFRCPLCRRHHHPPDPRYPVSFWANNYPINIFVKLKCDNHNVSADGICFCHEVHLCLYCLLKSHRKCCLSLNPTRKVEIFSYFEETSGKARIWKKRLMILKRKKEQNSECVSDLVYINETLVKLETFIQLIGVDMVTINQETLESATIKLISDDFEIFENTVATHLKPKPYSEFHVTKQELTQSPDRLIRHKLLSDDKIIAGFVEESKIFMISPEGKYLCEVLLLGRLISIDAFDDDLIIVLLKVSSSTAVGSCLQYLRYSETLLTPFNSHYLERSYAQIVALSKGKIIALYYEDHWIIDILQIKDSSIIASDNYILNSNVHPQIYPYDSQYIIYTNEIEVFRVNLQDKTEVCLLSKSRAQRNFIHRVSCLAVVFPIILIADVVNAVVYKFSSHGSFITIFLSEKMKDEKILSFHFNARGHILICFDTPQNYAYCLYNGEDFVWTEDS